ncbi:unnamed protein product [Cylindrotheca closterium]|uniref:Uncharacterized protein n=1 Tax=Cylindrotheca closterium TaxID=2856 RepID=A0AAD2CLV6_9STRA|nr:unnamed protein product [Cylindrotheca closterium]
MAGTPRTQKSPGGSATKAKMKTRSSPRKPSKEATSKINEDEINEDEINVSSTTATASSPPRKRRNSESKYETPDDSKIKKRSVKSTTAKTKQSKVLLDKTTKDNAAEVTTSTGKKRGRSKSPTASKGKKDNANADTTMTSKKTSSSHSNNIKKSKAVSTTMDVKVHRLRHLEYIPSHILAMTGSSSGGGYVAIAREDGSYQLSIVSSVQEDDSLMEDKKNKSLCLNPHIYPVTRVAGSSLAVAHSLCWVQPRSSSNDKNEDVLNLKKKPKNDLPTCVAASPDGTLWIVNFQQSQLQSRFSSGGGGIFDLCTCHDLPLVATACEDGSVRIWQIRSNKILDTPIATLTTAGSAVLSLAWRLVKLQNGLYETVLFAGVADGTIRKYKVNLSWKGGKDDEDELVLLKHQSHSLRMTLESKGRRQSTKVWTMKALQDGTLITGNSLGQVQFWNSDNGTLIQSILQSDLKADILQLAVNKEETKVFCTGVDSRVVCCERASYKKGGSSHMPSSMDVSPWVLTGAQRPHTHDIKAMVLLTSDDGRLETMITGGVDTKLCSYVASDFSKRRPQVWYPWPSHSPISTAPSQRIFSMQRQDHVEIYRLEQEPLQNGKSPNPYKKMRKSASDLVGSVQIESNTNLITSKLSPNGKWLVLCDASSTFIFKLNLEAYGKDDEFMFQPEQMELPDALKQNAATAFHFSGNVLFLATASTNTLFAIDLTTMEYTNIATLPIGDGSLPIHSIQTTEDFVVTLSHARGSGVQIFRRDPSSPLSFGSHWTIPSLQEARVAATCLIEGGQLAVATFASRLFIFDLPAKRLSKWSKQIGYPIKSWPAELSARRDFPVRLISNPSKPSQLILASFGAFCVINLSKALPEHCQMVPESHVRRRKNLMYRNGAGHRANKLQKLSKEDPNANNCIVCLHYNSMLYMDFLESCCARRGTTSMSHYGSNEKKRKGLESHNMKDHIVYALKKKKKKNMWLTIEPCCSNYHLTRSITLGL